MVVFSEVFFQCFCHVTVFFIDIKYKQNVLFSNFLHFRYSFQNLTQLTAYENFNLNFCYQSIMIFIKITKSITYISTVWLRVALFWKLPIHNEIAFLKWYTSTGLAKSNSIWCKHLVVSKIHMFSKFLQVTIVENLK